ncbi:ABC transporter permease [Komagataeibacter rhaeticus]|uniref:ABC transporter permease n=1 Tax=Komagataeibacter rhaeticus TaxID=215221 RepID=UPI0004DA7E38|nr:ABC transporter permease [Komagataeibacter rhaeticus]KDU96062.1 hypothetical protein GLUCORHAEAF1_04615 [Komagataeibacter rhaeticus AF1]MBL7238687.1 ABC transporter permease [Komagataeibacter rhaeticus]PYD52998.1 ABC transporter permease [Komagataeibacter rhaeticus]GBQ09148.1 ABC transporter permease [Komagataeibacter rhaeticus DSM 16663]
MHNGVILTIILTGLRLGVPVMLAAMGEVFGESAGVLNVGLEGMLLLGGITSFMVAASTHSALLGTLAVIPVALLAAELLGVYYIRLGASQIVTGIVFNLLSLGVASYAYRLYCPPGTLAARIQTVETTLWGIPLPVFPVIALCVIMHLVLMHSRFGMAVRAVGEAPAAAEAAGLDVTRVRMAALRLSCIGGALAGAYLIVCQIGLFRDSIVQGQGFSALAVVIFGRWRPLAVGCAAVLLGCLDALQFSLQAYVPGLPPQVFLALPYLAAALATSGLFGRMHQPAALTIPWMAGRRVQ